MEFNYWGEFITVATVHLLAVASPGPDFAMVVRQSLIYGKKTAIQTSLGIGAGIMVHVAYSLLGIGLIISQTVSLFNTMKLLGATYLIYIGIKSLRAKASNSDLTVGPTEIELPSTFGAFRAGFLTNGLNPKATLFFLSLFTVVISPDTPHEIQFCYGLYMTLATALWFSGLSTVLGYKRVRSLFQQKAHWIERTVGVVLIGLGIKLVTARIN